MQTSLETGLPVASIKGEFISSLKNNVITILSTPTGSGKTMLAPYWVSNLTGRTVYVLVPRVVVARTAEAGAKKIIYKNPKDVASMTGRGDSGNGGAAKVVYITEGSFIHRNISDKLNPQDIVIVDEVHEQGALTEALLLQAKVLSKRGIKTVLMSATLDIERYKAYYEKDGISVGVCVLPPTQRPYPLEHRTVENPLREILSAAANGGRCLIGVDGKDTIERIVRELSDIAKTMGVKIPIFPFHGEMELDEQDVVLNHRGAMVVVGTNVLQSGVTIEGLGFGWFNGLGKRITMQAGRKTLVTYELSQAECTQWYGRIGRTLNGVIFQTEGQATKFQYRDPMPVPEILRSPLEETILMFNSIGLDIRTADLLNKPSEENIAISYSRLTKMGLVDENGNTELGCKVFTGGQGLRAGIIVELGKKFGIENTARKIAAVLSCEHFCRKANYSKFNNLTKVYNYSDYMVWVKIAEYFVEKYGYKVPQARYNEFKFECEESGLFRKNLENIMRRFAHIDGVWDNKTQSLTGGYTDALYMLDEVKYAVVDVMTAAFADSVFTAKYGSWYSEDGLMLRSAQSVCADTSKAIKVVGDITRIEIRRGYLNLMDGLTIIEAED